MDKVKVINYKFYSNKLLAVPKQSREERKTTEKWKQFEFQMHDINNKIDNERKKNTKS